MGPRRTLQLSLVVSALAALVLALTGVLSPASASPGEPVPLPTSLPAPAPVTAPLFPGG